MRVFILVSRGFTTPKFKDFYRAGRLDIAIHSIIHVFFISNGLRKNIDFNLFLYGPPDPPKRIQIISSEETPWSKKDVGTLIKISLWKYKKNKRVEALKNVFIEKKNLEEILKEYKQKNYKIYLLDVEGKNIDEVEIEKNSVFILGDFLGLEKEHLKIAQKYADEIVSLNKVNYFSSQCITILNYYYEKKFGCEFWDTSYKFKF
jgi:tRNA (pseudouridine54-N1)-methyltransferase